MGLKLLHHKSFHVYNAENIERVQRDEEKARLEAAGQVSQVRLAVSIRFYSTAMVVWRREMKMWLTLLIFFIAAGQDSESRLEILRKRAKKHRGGRDEAELALERQLEGGRASSSKALEEEERQTSRAVIVPPPVPEPSMETNGHINFWADLEKGVSLPPFLARIFRENTDAFGLSGAATAGKTTRKCRIRSGQAARGRQVGFADDHVSRPAG
jgi:hypothetical protein